MDNQVSSESGSQSEGYWWRSLGRSIPVLRYLSIPRTRFLLLLCFFAGLAIASTQMLMPGWIWRRARQVLPVALTTRVSSFWLPIVVHENLYRPRFNREVYTASTWPDGTVWVGGEQGFLAYSRNRGETWTCLEFDRLRGVFTSPRACGAANGAINGSSPTAEAISLLNLPRVFAAQNQVSTPLNAQMPFEQRSPTSTTSVPSGVDDQQVLLSELSHNFGSVDVGQPSKLFSLKVRGTPATKGIRISAKVVSEDGSFQLLGNEQCQLFGTGVCEFTAEFLPRKAVSYRADMVLVTEPLKQSVQPSSRSYTISLQGIGQNSIPTPAEAKPVPDNSGNRAVATSQPAAPTYVPGDVLALALVANANGELNHELVMASGSRLTLLMQRSIRFRTSDPDQAWLRPTQPVSGSFAGRPPDEEAQVRLAQNAKQPCPKVPTGGTLVSAARTAMTEQSVQLTGCRGVQGDPGLHLNAIALHDASTGYAVGGTPGHGLVYRIDTDGHAPSFTPLTRDAATEGILLPITLKVPPPWLLTLTGMCLFVGWIVSMRPQEPTKQGIEAMAVNDRPLEARDADAVRLRAVAEGISRFFRNPSTRAPLVLCINGQWGSGKSSLMNLLADDLLNQQHTVIQFNAWHHQSEEQILASLLQAVRQNALHSPWTLAGAWTRLRIFIKRWPERWFVSVVFALATVWTVLLARDFLVVGKLDPSRFVAFIPAFVTTLVTLRTIAQGFTGFLSNPASLLATNGKGSKSELEDQTTLRERFAQDFGTVTQVLGNGKLILLIDDLDRCSPEKIRDVVEAMNFLVTAGECYIVLGMARQVVEYYLGQSFSKAIEAMPAPLLGLTEDEVKGEGVRESAFAKLYLQKLIQLQFNLLPFTDTQAITLLRSGKKSAVEELALSDFANDTREVLRWEDRLRWTQRTVQRWFLPIMGTLLFLFGAMHTLDSSAKWVWTQVSPYIEDKKATSPSQISAVANAPATTVNMAINPESSPPSSASSLRQDQGKSGSEAAAKTSAATTNQTPTPSVLALLPVHESKEELKPEDVQVARSEPGVIQVLLLVLVLGGGMWLLAQWWLITRPDTENAQDSNEFLGALADWGPALLAIYKTPRGLKQFLNSVRFLAMLQRSQLEPAEGAERQPLMRRIALKFVARRNVAKRNGILAALKAQACAGLSDQLRIPDELLVTLAVLHSNARIAKQSRTWFEGGQGFFEVNLSLQEKGMVEALRATAKRSSAAPGSTLEQLRDSLARHDKAFCKLNGQTE